MSLWDNADCQVKMLGSTAPMEVSHTLVDKSTPCDCSTALRVLPQHISAFVKEYEPSTAYGFEDLKRQLHPPARPA